MLSSFSNDVRKAMIQSLVLLIKPLLTVWHLVVQTLLNVVVFGRDEVCHDWRRAVVVLMLL